MKVFALGSEGSFTSQVADELNQQQFGGHLRIVLRFSNVGALKSLLDPEEVLGALAVVPVRNSIEGPVKDVVRFWEGHGENYWEKLDQWHWLQVIKQIDLPIHQNLLVRPGVSLGNIQQVLSHPQGLAQCEETLTSLGIPYESRKTVQSTALAAKMISQDDACARSAAVGPRACAAMYGLEVIRENIEDVPGNETRFHLVVNAPQAPFPSANAVWWKMALVWTLENAPGALYRTLKVIEEAGLNMEFITSIQSGNGLNSVLFYVEMEAPPQKKEQNSLLASLKSVTQKAVCLGVFPETFTIE